MKAQRFLITATALVGLGGLLLEARGQSGGASQSPPGTAQGKKIFVERCAKCHGDDGTKPLDSGPPLAERKLSDEQLAKNVRGRLKSAPEDQQRAVAAYIRSFQKK